MANPEAIFFDTNIHINLFRNPFLEKRLAPLLQGAYLFVVNKIVLMELWAGAQTKREIEILNDLQNEFPLIGLKDDAFITAGKILNRLSKKSLQGRRKMTWDLLIALSAQENNALVVTGNSKDFQKLQKFVNFEFLPFFTDSADEIL